MFDTRAVAQEVQDQFTAAMHKGHEQIRKSRESVTTAVRAGGQIADAVKPNLPKLPSVQVKLPSLSEITSPEKLRASAHELASQMLATQRKLTDQALASQRKLASHAQDLAEQAVSRQRKLGDRALEVAGPFITDGVAKLAQAAGTFVPSRRTEREDHAESLTRAGTAEPVAAESTDAESAPAADSPVAAESATEAKAGAKPRSTRAAGTAKTGTAKTRTAKTSTGKTADPAKTGTAKTGAAKTGAAKTRTSAAKSGAASKARPTQK